MTNIDLKEWIENMEYDLEKLMDAKLRIEHLEKIRKKDIIFLRNKLKIDKNKKQKVFKQGEVK